MKKLLIVPFMFLLSFAFVAKVEAQVCKLKISWTFKNIEAGYDHKNKVVLYMDEEKIATSTESLESKKNKLVVKVPRGEHSIRIVDMAFYEEAWEEHTVDNEYSIDCLFEGDKTLGKRAIVKLVFDIDKGTTYTWK